MFNPEEFLNLEVTEANSTQSVPVPVGEYTALVEDIKVRPWKSKDDPTKQGMALDIIWAIDSQPVRDLLGRDKVTCKQGVMLDLNDLGGLDTGKGKNVGLGRLREAMNLNIAGQPFSFPMLKGRVAKIKVEHRVDGENIYAEVKAVARA